MAKAMKRKPLSPTVLKTKEPIDPAPGFAMKPRQNLEQPAEERVEQPIEARRIGPWPRTVKLFLGIF